MAFDVWLIGRLAMRFCPTFLVFFTSIGLAALGEEVPKEAIEAWKQAERDFPKAGTWTIDVEAGSKSYRWVVSLLKDKGRLLENDQKVFVSKKGDAIDFVLNRNDGKKFELRSADKDERLAYSRVLSAIFAVKRPWCYSPNLTLVEFFAEKETTIKKVTERGDLVEIEFDRTNRKNPQKCSMTFDKSNRWSLVSSKKNVSDESESGYSLDYDADGRLVSARLEFPKSVVTVKIVSFDPSEPSNEIFELSHYGIDQEVVVPKIRSSGIHPTYFFVAIGLAALAFSYIRMRRRG